MTVAHDLHAGQHAYVVALVPGRYLGTPYDQWFQNAGKNGWIPLDGPLQPFYTASTSGSVDLEVVKNLSLYRLDGTQLYFGIGDSAEEMIANKRYCGLMQAVPQQR